jgi:hypothetical protein
MKHNNNNSNNMKKRLMISLGAVLLCAAALGQKVAVKTNLLYGATETPNLGIELGLGKRTTLDLSIGYNPWTFHNNRKWKHLLVEPEFRYWTNERFKGHFFGVHGLYAFYNIGGVDLPLPNLGKVKIEKEYRYQGNAYGGGISYGYHWELSPRLGLEFNLGVGIAHLDYKQYDCGKCGEFIAAKTKTYIGPTKAGISLVYKFGAPARPVARPIDTPPVILVEGPPLVVEAPKPVKTTGERLAETMPFIARASTSDLNRIFSNPYNLNAFIDDAYENSLKIAYAQGKMEVDPYYADNWRSLDEIIRSIREIESSIDSRVTGIIIAGFASPEGSSQYNQKLARDRADALRRYLLNSVRIDNPRIRIYNGEINYRGLRELVAASNMPYRYSVLDIIDNTPIWDSRRKVGRLGELQRLANGAPYRYMYREFFPQLRVAAYIKVLYDNK